MSIFTEAVEAHRDVPLACTCPRCGAEVTETYYGPCGACRAALVATAEATPVPEVDYTPEARIDRTDYWGPCTVCRKHTANPAGAHRWCITGMGTWRAEGVKATS